MPSILIVENYINMVSARDYFDRKNGTTTTYVDNLHWGREELADERNNFDGVIQGSGCNLDAEAKEKGIFTVSIETTKPNFAHWNKAHETLLRKLAPAGEPQDA